MELIVDVDTLVYRFAIANLEVIQWDPQCYTYDGDAAKAGMEMDLFIENLQAELGCSDLYVGMSDLDNSFRRKVYRDYKANRAGNARPLLFGAMRSHATMKHGAVVMPGLEGDDVCAMRAAENGWKDCIIASIDKDFGSLPCAFYNWDKPAEGIRNQSVEAAERFFLYQILVGDQTDNYKGVRGIGPVKANALLDKVAGEYGKGLEAAWAKGILPAFEKTGQGAAEALMNARCAHLLRHGEYEQTKTGYRVKLWTPPGVEPFWMEVK